MGGCPFTRCLGYARRISAAVLKKPFELIHTEVTYRGRVVDVRRDQVRLPTGRVVQLDVVKHQGAVTAIPVDDEDQIWFVRQYRYPAEAYLMELPAGTLEAGEPPDQCVLREIREEIGMAADQLVAIGSFYLAPGYSTEFMYVYLAKNLRPDPLELDVDEVIEVVKIPVDQAYKMIFAGKFQDAKTIAALHLAREYLLGS